MRTSVGQILEYGAQCLNQKLGVDQLMNARQDFNGIIPWLQRPNKWKDFTPTDVGVIGIVGSSTTILTYPVPTGYDGVIEAIFFEYTASSFDRGDLIYRMFIDGRPVDNLEAIRTNLGTSQIFSPVRIQVYSGNIVTMVAEHVNNGTLDDKEVKAGVKGYLYARSDM